jgi:ABC-type amino acid transport substrate-binding protein
MTTWFAQRAQSMRRLLLPIATAAMGLAMVWAGGAAQDRPQSTKSGTITLLTDSISEPSGPATLAVYDLADQLARGGKIRVLPVAGLGAVANVRDLLSLRSIDIAVLNSDILAFLDQTGEFPSARQRLRYLAHLYDQHVYLLARRNFNALEDLRGRRLIVGSRQGGSYITATTLFNLQKIDVTLESLGPEALLDDARIGDFDGALLLSGELARLRLSAQMRRDFHLLPVALTPALQATYRPALIEGQATLGLAEPAKVETIALSTLLVARGANLPRSGSPDVQAFINAFYSALPELRRRSPTSIWRRAEIQSLSPGWTRHPAAEPKRVLDAAQLADLARAMPSEAFLRPPHEPAPEAVQKHKIHLLATARAPLTDERLPDGGLATALLSSGLSAQPPEGMPAEIEIRWTKSAGLPIQSLLSDRSIDLYLPSESVDCEQPGDLMQISAVLCDNVLFSEPILQVVIGLFTLSDSSFKFDNDESIHGKLICVPGDRDASVLNANGRKWVSQKRVVVLRQSTLLGCVSAVQQHEADAFVANDLEAQYMLGRLGLSALFKMLERPLGTRGVHAIVSRDHAQAFELIDAVNSGLRRLRESEAYAAIVRRHLMRLWETAAGVP